MQPLEHRLFAIVFTDIVGYTATMQKSEKEAWEQVERHQKIIELSVNKFGGKVLNYYGDGSLSIFPSVTDALDATGLIQQMTSDSPETPLRIGIHLGEIIKKDGQYLGDGINIASRIQSEAGTGEIFVSEGVYQMSKNKANYQFESKGAFKLKNVQEPIILYKVTINEINLPKNKRPKKISKSSRWIKLIFAMLILGLFSWYVAKTYIFNIQSKSQALSILILPFDDQQSSDSILQMGIGIADEVRSKLAGIQDLEVKSRSSSMHFLDKNLTANEIADQLDVSHILEGSIRLSPGQYYINLALIDAQRDQLIQPMDFRGEISNDFIMIQNQIAKNIIDLIKIKLLPEEEEKIAKVETENLDAFKDYLMGKHFWGKSSSAESLEKSKQFFLSAIQKDPTFAKAHAALADHLMQWAGFGIESVAEGLRKAKPYAIKSFKLDSTIAESNHAMGTIHLYEEDLILAKRRLLRAIEIDPTNELSYFTLAWIESYQGNQSMAIKHIQKAIQLYPFSPVLKAQEANILMQDFRFEEAIEVADTLLTQYKDHLLILFFKGIAQTMIGDVDGAIQTFLQRPVPTRQYNFALGYAYAVKGDTLKAREVLDYLLDRTKNKYVPPSQIACVYLGLGDMENVYHWFSKEDLYYLKILPMFLPLRQDPHLNESFKMLESFKD